MSGRARYWPTVALSTRRATRPASRSWAGRAGCRGRQRPADVAVRGDDAPLRRPSIVDNLARAEERDHRDHRDAATGDPRHLLRDPRGVPAGQRDVRRAAPVDLHDLAGEHDLRPAVVTDGDLEDAARPDGEEVRVVRVVVDDAPLWSEQSRPAAPPAAVPPRLAAARGPRGEPATSRRARPGSSQSSPGWLRWSRAHGLGVGRRGRPGWPGVAWLGPVGSGPDVGLLGPAGLADDGVEPVTWAPPGF